jgi:hypothetical protein
MAPHDMWDANPVYTHSFYGAYIEMLEREMGWRVDSWHPIEEEVELDVNEEREPDVEDAMEEGFECEEVLSDSDDEIDLDSFLLYQEIVTVVNSLPPLGSAQNPIDLTGL